jgi:thiol-disulfide isomerase/thioredoxin
MKKVLLILLLFVYCTNINGQTVVKGNIKNYRNKPLAIKTSEYDSIRSVNTDSEGDFFVDLQLMSSFECNIYLGKKNINFFSAPPDTVTITADYNNLQKSLFIDNKQRLSPSTTKLKIVAGDHIDSLPALIPHLNNKVTLIEIWATWCSPCIAQQKLIAKYKAKYDNLGVNFFYISMDKQEQKEKWQRFIYANALEGMHLLANNKLWDDIVVNKKYSAIPVYLIVDKEGHLHHFKAGESKKEKDMYALFNRQIAELFAVVDNYVK